jgi:hypothetical protein
MKHSSVYWFRYFFRSFNNWLILIVLLSGCTSSYLQSESARFSEYFNGQNLVGKRFETKLPITVFKLGHSRFVALHDVPLAIVISDRKPNDLVYYEPLITLPSGTVLEMVGELAWRSSAINVQPAANFNYFIVHDIAEASDLLLPFSSGLTQAGLHGQTPRKHIQINFPEPFLLEVDVPSKWTCARYDIINGAEWHKGFNLKISKRVIRPACDLSTPQASQK